MNVIFIMNDSFRQDHLGCYGSRRIHTPNLDKFAQHAAIFDRYYIGSYPTVPHRFDLHTGRFGFPYRGWEPLERGDVTWAQLLKRQGIHTQMIWDTPMLGLHDYNYTRGFDGVLFVHGQKGDPWITDPSLPIQLPAQPHKIKNIHSMENYLRNHYGRRHEVEYCAPRTMTEAMSWLETNTAHKSFFLYIDMWDPHEPFDCPPADYARYADPDYAGDFMLYPEYGRPTYMSEGELHNARALYAGNVTLVDRWVGRFFDLVERLGLLEDTLILWASDHGHLFGEHDLQGKPGAELGKLYEVTTRIPLLVHHPAGWGARQHIGGIVQPPDILPSILEFLDIPVPAAVEGRSFWPLVKGETDAIRDYAFSSRYPPVAGDASYAPVEGATFDGWAGSDRSVEPSTVTSREWAYLAAPAGRPSELYHLTEDPAQAHNVIDQYPDVAAAMRQAWLDFLRAHAAPESRLRPFLDANVDVHTPHGGELYAFRDDHGTWVAFATESAAKAAAWRENAPGPERTLTKITFGDLLQDNPKNLVRLYNQFYWAEDLA
jgi:arylsulfatase A-like enzyme